MEFQTESQYQEELDVYCMLALYLAANMCNMESFANSRAA